MDNGVNEKLVPNYLDKPIGYIANIDGKPFEKVGVTFQKKELSWLIEVYPVPEDESE